MSRMPLLQPSEYDEEQRALAVYIEERTLKGFEDIFKVKNDDGTYTGPFGIYMQCPPVGQHYFGIANTLNKLNGLPKPAREVAIIATGVHYRAAYEIYAHARMAAWVHLPASDIQQICQGVRPEGLDEACGVAYDVAQALTKRPGPLEEGLYARSVRVLGAEGTVALIQYVGFYAFTSIILNGHNIPVPKSG